MNTQEAVDKKVLELDMQHEVLRQEYLNKGASEEGIKLNDHLSLYGRNFEVDDRTDDSIPRCIP